MKREIEKELVLTIKVKNQKDLELIQQLEDLLSRLLKKDFIDSGFSLKNKEKELFIPLSKSITATINKF